MVFFTLIVFLLLVRFLNEVCESSANLLMQKCFRKNIKNYVMSLRLRAEYYVMILSFLCPLSVPKWEQDWAIKL